MPQRLVLRAVQPFLLGDTRLAIGDTVEFSSPEERQFFISHLNWTAFRVEFVDVPASSIEDAADGEDVEREVLRAEVAGLRRVVEEQKALIATPSTPLVCGGLPEAILLKGRDGLIAIDGIGAKSADSLLAWAAAQQVLPHVDIPGDVDAQIAVTPIVA